MADIDWRSDREKAARDLLGAQNEAAARKHDWVPGDFVTALFGALYRADATNRALIGIGFPAMAQVVAIWKDSEDGYAQVHGLAGWEPGR